MDHFDVSMSEENEEKDHEDETEGENQFDPTWSPDDEAAYKKSGDDDADVQKPG